MNKNTINDSINAIVAQIDSPERRAIADMRRQIEEAKALWGCNNPTLAELEARIAQAETAVSK